MFMKSATLAATLSATIGTALIAAPGSTLIPRVEVRKTPTPLLELPSDFTGRLVIKFQDEVQARPHADGTINSSNGTNVAEANEAIAGLGVQFKWAYPGISEARLRAVEAKARNYSGKKQPDLAGMMYLVGDNDAALLEAARRLNESGLTEFVSFERDLYPGGDPTLPAYPNYRNFDEAVQVELANGPIAGPPVVGQGKNILFDQEFEPWIATRNRDALRELDGIVEPRAAYPTPRILSIAEEDKIRVERARLLDENGPGYINFAFGGDEDPDCGVADTGSCFGGANGSPFCDDGACCEQICQIDEFCCDDQFGEWDDLCSDQANLFCGDHTPNPGGDDPPPGPDRCNTGAQNASCFEFHFTGGCENSDCCNTVCDIDPNCCNNIWSFDCVEIAFLNCAAPFSATDTPDLTAGQGYTTAAPWDLASFPLPAPLDIFQPATLDPTTPATGHDGRGVDLFTAGETFDDWGLDGVFGTGDEGEGNQWKDAGEPWDAGTHDLDGDLTWDAPRGILGLAQMSLFRDGVDRTGEGILARGKNRRAGVIEWACYTDHEEFAPLVVGGTVLDGKRMTLEPGTRPFFDEDIGSPSHGTACAGILVARDETAFGEPARGVTGMVPEADGFFFPIADVAEGPREFSAWIAMLETFELGDVVSASYGPGGSNLNLTPGLNTLFSVGTGIGIQIFVSAGNSCTDLAQAADGLPDSGAIVVGAGSPGANTPRGRGYRLPFSSYTGTDEVYDINDPRQVGLYQWGTKVVTTGYGDLFRIDLGNGDGTDGNRAYTATFGGTSAASPIQAGMAAAFQGFHRQFYGFSASPARLRGLLGAPGEFLPVPPRLFGNFDNDPCGLDIVPSQPQNHIGASPTGADQVIGIIQQPNQGFDQSPYLRDIVIVRGDRTFGSLFSVLAADAEFYQAVPTPTRNDDRPSTIGEGGVDQILTPLVTIPEISSARYLLGGEIVDLVAVCQLPVDESPIAMGVNVISGPTEIPFSLIVGEMYNFKTNSWTLLGLGVAGAVDWTVGNPADHVNKTGRVLVRVYQVGFGSVSGQGVASEWISRTNLINLTFTGGVGN